MEFADVWSLVAKGGDVAVYAILYYAYSIQAKVTTLEVKYNSLRSWVSRLDDKIDRRNHAK